MWPNNAAKPEDASGSESAGAEANEVDDNDSRIQKSPVRGNWYEAVVQSVDPQDSSIQVGCWDVWSQQLPLR